MNEIRQKFNELYDKHIGKVYRFIFFKVNSQEVAEDLTSEAFLRTWKALMKKAQSNKVKNIENQSAFLYQIARNLVIDHYREKGRFQTVAVENVQIHDTSVDLEKKAIADSDLGIIKSALFNLKEDYKDVVVLHYLEDLTIPEVAKIIKKSEGATRVILHRALSSLRSNLNGDINNSKLAVKEA